MCNLPTRICSLLLITLLFAHCGNKKTSEMPIPANASFAMVLDMNRMSSKAVEWKDIFSTRFLQQMTGNGSQADLLGKVLNGGFDYQKKVYVFSKADADLQNSYVGISFTLKSEQAFEKMLKNEYKNIDIKRDRIYQYAHITAGVFISWQKQNALLLLAPKIDTDVFKGTAYTLHKIKKHETLIAQNATFQDAMQTEADIIGWVNGQDIANNASKLLKKGTIDLPAPFSEMLNALKDGTFHTDFEKGQVKTNIKGFCNPENAQIFSKLLKNNTDQEIMKQIPIENPALLVGLGANPKGMDMFLGESTFILALKAFLSFSGNSIDEILQNYTGDLVLAIDKPQLSADLSEQDVVACLGTKDAQKVTDLIESFGMFLKIRKKEGFSIIKSSEYGDWYMVGKGKMIFFTTSPKLKDAILAGKPQLNAQTVSLFKDKVGVFEIDYAQATQNLSFIPYSQNLAQVLDKFQITASPFQNNVWDLQSILKIKDKDRNALAVILEALKDASKVIE